MGRGEFSLLSASRAIVAESASKVFSNSSSNSTAQADVIAFRDLNLTVDDRETLCVVGPSGCGKTTFLRCTAGLTELTNGSLLLYGQPIRRVPDGVALVFQHFGLLPWKTVYDNAAFGLAMAGAPKSVIQDRVEHYLDLVGLGGFDRYYPYQLSGGMQQRVGLVRALATNPSVLLLDEPFAALDAQTREVLQEELLAIMHGERKTMVFVTHSIDEAILLGDRIVVMSARPGRVRETVDVPFGRPRDVDAIRGDPRFAELREHIWRGLRPEAAAAVAAR